MVSVEKVDAFLNDNLRSGLLSWPPDWGKKTDSELAIDRILYHGIGGLLLENGLSASDWPAALRNAVRFEGVNRAKWELRHRPIISEVCEALASKGIPSIVLKGTALAYSVYGSPTHRYRADTDVLINPDDCQVARETFASMGLLRSSISMGNDSSVNLQEGWTATLSDGSTHCIDLHWQVVNAPSLRRILPNSECFERSRLLPQLAPEARSLSASDALLHSIVHRAMHITAPYQVGDQRHHGGDRLIWKADADRIMQVMDENDWEQFSRSVHDFNLREVCLTYLDEAASASRSLPHAVREAVGDIPRHERESRYLLHSNARTRAICDFRAIDGVLPKVQYAFHRTIPKPSFIRAKYPKFQNRNVLFLYALRIWEWLSDRKKSGEV